MNQRGNGGPADKDILALIATGDVAGATTLTLRAYGPDLMGFLWGLLREEDAVRDVYGQFCEDLWRGIRSFKGRSAYRTWAYQLAHNAACRFLRQPFRRRVRPLLTGELARVALEARESTASFKKTTSRNKIARLRERLAPIEQTMLFLRIDQKMSWREVADVLSTEQEPVDAAAARKRFERLKTRLRELAKAEGLLT